MTPPPTALSRYGGWLPRSRKVHNAFLQEHLHKAIFDRKGNAPHKPAVQEFEKAILSSELMTRLFNKIFLQASPQNTITDFDTLLYAMDDIVEAAPKFQFVEGEEGEPIGVPLYLIFDLLMNTNAAHDLFRIPEFNVAIKNLLDSWGAYLTTPESSNTLTDQLDGWFGKHGIASLEADGRGVFNETYVTPDPNAVSRGYESWDAFFIREVQNHARPVQMSGDPKYDDTLIHNACESTVYRIAREVKRHDQFWLKAQKYSLYDMLSIGADHSFVDSFVGGTVYQAFLSPQDYHRWRSPVDGVIKKAVVVPGTYYVVLPDGGADSDDPELTPGDPHGAMLRSQSFLTMSSTRALIFIEATKPAVGLMCFIGVGMAEVSTCQITVQDGQKVKTGDELGMFRFGGSTHALVFGPQVDIVFHDGVIVDTHQNVNTILAQVKPKV